MTNITKQLESILQRIAYHKTSVILSEKPDDFQMVVNNELERKFIAMRKSCTKITKRIDDHHVQMRNDTPIKIWVYG